MIAAILAVGAAVLLLAEERSPPPIQNGLPAPGFSLPALGAPADGAGPPGALARVSLESLRGKVVLLNFWATWCKPCEDEMPAMEQLYRELAPSGFELVAVSVDEDPDAVREFRDRLGLTFPILLDPDREVAGTFQTFRFPETYLIDREGVLVARFIGPREWDAPAYGDRIRALLGEG